MNWIERVDPSRKNGPIGDDRRQPIPAILFGRLAVDRSLQGQGLGAYLLIDALRRTLQTAKEIGVHALVVDALDDQARAFYVKYGFEPLTDDQNHLFLPVKVIAQLGLAPAD